MIKKTKTKLKKGILSKITSLDEETLIAIKDLGTALKIVAIGVAVGLALGTTLLVLKLEPLLIEALK